MEGLLRAAARCDEAGVRDSFYVKPGHEVYADHMAEMFVTFIAFHHEVDARFPGRKEGFASMAVSDVTVAAALRELPAVSVVVEGDRATFVGPAVEDERSPTLGNWGWKMINDGGRWKVDLEAGYDLDNYPPFKESHTGLAMQFLMHEACEEVRELTEDLRRGRIGTLEALRARVKASGREVNRRVDEKLAAGRRAATRPG
jgi:hypothetical protein